MLPGRIRFCQLTTFYPPQSFGGDAMFVYRLANSLAARGHEVDVIHCADSYKLLARGPLPAPLPHHPGVTVHTLHSRLGALSPLLTQQTGRPWLKTGKIRRVLESRKFDVLHYHNVSLLGPKALEIYPGHDHYVRLYTAHEHWLICPMHVLWKDGRRTCDTPRCLRCTLRSRRPPQWWRYTKLLQESSEFVDQFISPSRFSIDMHSLHGFHKPFVQLPCFSPAPDANAHRQDVNGRPYFLFAGRLEKIKGLHTLIPVFAQYPQADLLIAGRGDYEAELRRLASGAHNISFLGWLPPGRLAALYRNAISIIVPSVCCEVFSMVLLEAFSNRTPAIVSASGALPEIIRDCQGGFIFTNEAELLSAMEQLQTSPDLRRQLGDNAYGKWEQNWSEDAHLRMYLDILSQTAQRKWGFVPWAAPRAK